MNASNLVFGERDISKYNISVALEVFADFVPGRGLLDSSASALRSNPPNEHCLSCIDVCLDKLIRICCGEFRGVFPMVVWVDPGVNGACQDSANKEAESRHRLSQEPGAAK
jgi:hypothetical protein